MNGTKNVDGENCHKVGRDGVNSGVTILNVASSLLDGKFLWYEVYFMDDTKRFLRLYSRALE